MLALVPFVTVAFAIVAMVSSKAVFGGDSGVGGEVGPEMVSRLVRRPDCKPWPEPAWGRRKDVGVGVG